jgi:ribonuclease HII
MAGPSLDLERACLARGAGAVAGVDEVGRGPLAGPVVAAAVVLDPDRPPLGADDSKKLSARARETFFDTIMRDARAVALGFGSVEEIARLNIRAASLLAMRRAIEALALPPDMALIDGNALPPDLPCPARAIVKGDSLSLSIAAASIVAKVTRDRLMARLHVLHPAYGFDRHAGYGTAAHLKALAEHGATESHRRDFAPVAAVLARSR